MCGGEILKNLVKNVRRKAVPIQKLLCCDKLGPSTFPYGLGSGAAHSAERFTGVLNLCGLLKGAWRLQQGSDTPFVGMTDFITAGEIYLTFSSQVSNVVLHCPTARSNIVALPSRAIVPGCKKKVSSGSRICLWRECPDHAPEKRSNITKGPLALFQSSLHHTILPFPLFPPPSAVPAFSRPPGNMLFK